MKSRYLSGNQPNQWRKEATAVARKYFKRLPPQGTLVLVNMKTGECLCGDEQLREAPPLKSGGDVRLIRIGARTAFKIHSPSFC